MASTSTSRLLLRGGMVIDGTGAPARAADVLIEGDRIVALVERDTHSGTPAGDIAVRDITGLTVAPGFIDSHTHDDGYLLSHRDMVPKVSQGITTVVTGNCGISLAPSPDAGKLPQPLDLLGPRELFRFPRFADWLAALQDTPAAVNVIPLVGHTTLRVAVMEDLQRPATPEESARMRDLLGEALEAGAFGMSTGTFYPPAAHATTREIIDVGDAMRARGGIYATHLRDEADHIDAAIEEALEIGQALGARVVFSHHKLAGERNHGHSAVTLARIGRASTSQPVCLDCHPYPATSTMLRLDRVRLARRTMITWSDGYPAAQGRDFDELQRELGLDDDQMLAHLSPAGAIYFLMSQDDVDRILADPQCMVGSDGLPFDKHPHPRQWGTFTRILADTVRERGLLSLETAIHKMTGLAARYYGLPDRGQLQPGMRADLVVFDAATVTDRATFDAPIQASEGIAGVWVNGVCVWDGKHPTGAYPGRMLVPMAV
ncbi:N-acyl-D-amino-acid deacylase family protein [Cupriavidus pampae]|uniref:N-acyl-D-aspartate deacylase n=1 Tax=Cupriavidus pampae TaxID=659251 RepID=A0ABN7Z8U5_9BURK|nr:D-aminoacylase [Cupriavidus pampae]CAG9180494.1 N-acyl-D-aspartate deacylase [Cupriavidus pampae]